MISLFFQIQNIINSEIYYRVRDTKKAKFIRVVITKEFMSNFVDKGTFSAVSNKWKIENGNFMMSHDVIVPLKGSDHEI